MIRVCIVFWPTVYRDNPKLPPLSAWCAGVFVDLILGGTPNHLFFGWFVRPVGRSSHSALRAKGRTTFQKARDAPQFCLGWSHKTLGDWMEGCSCVTWRARQVPVAHVFFKRNGVVRTKRLGFVGTHAIAGETHLHGTRLSNGAHETLCSAEACSSTRCTGYLYSSELKTIQYKNSSISATSEKLRTLRIWFRTIFSYYKMKHN